MIARLLASSTTSADRLARLNAALIVAAAAAHVLYVLYGPLNLSGDEAYYWEYSRRLDWSYYAKGPMIAWLIAASTAVFGSTELGVRLPAVLIGAGVMVVMADLAARVLRQHRPQASDLDVQRARLWALLLIITQPMLAAGGVLMTIDTPFVLFWALALWGLYRALFEGWSAGWYVAGLAGGLGFLTKYTIVLLAGCVVLFILVDALRNRARLRLLASGHLWASAALATFLTLPVWAWNARHDWVGFRHVAGQARDGTELNLARPWEILGAQALNPLTFVLIVLAWGLALRAWAAARRGEPASASPANAVAGDLFLVCCSLPVLVFFMAAAVQTKVQANWPVAFLVAAIVLVAAGVVRANPASAPDATPGGPPLPAVPLARVSRRLAKIAVWVGLPLVVIGHDTRLLYALGLDPRYDPASRLMGWSELGRQVSAVRAANPGVTALVSDHYMTAALMSFYVAGQPFADLSNFDNRRMDQYDLWNGGVLGVPDGGSAVLVMPADALNMGKPYRPAEFFERFESIGTVHIYRQGAPLTTFPWKIVVARGFKKAAYQAAQEELRGRRY